MYLLHKNVEGEWKKLNKFFRNIGVYLIIFALVLAMAYLYRGGAPQEEINWRFRSSFVPLRW